jgi:hypothetical protein
MRIPMVFVQRERQVSGARKLTPEFESTLIEKQARNYRNQNHEVRTKSSHDDSVERMRPKGRLLLQIAGQPAFDYLNCKFPNNECDAYVRNAVAYG